MGFFQNWNGLAHQLAIILINTASQPTNFTIEAPEARFHLTGVVDGNGDLVVMIPTSLTVLSQTSAVHSSKGIHVSLDSDKIVVFGQNERGATSDTFFALPYKRTKRAVIYYGMSLPGFISSLQSAILIVGTEDNTIMKLTVTQTATTNTGNTLLTGREYSFAINRLQTFYIRSTGDLTGTKIVTDKQVSVFSGHEGARMPHNDFCCWDVLVEQIPPATSWGRIFYITPLVSRLSYTIKILASLNFTRVDIFCKDSVESVNLIESQHYNKTLSQQESCAIHSNQPILVVQFSHSANEDGGNHGDPMMMIIPATSHFSRTFRVSSIRNPTTPDYQHHINIIVLAQYYQPDMIQLISGGRNISPDTQRWIPIKVDGISEAYATQVNVSEGIAEIIHPNESALMTVNSYGFAQIDSYGHPGRLQGTNNSFCLCNLCTVM